MDEARILRLPSRVVFDTVPGVLEQAAVALQPGGGDAAVDLSGCTEFDSSLIALLLELRRRMAGASAGRLRVTDPPPNLRKLAALYGVDELLFERD